MRIYSALRVGMMLVLIGLVCMPSFAQGAPNQAAPNRTAESPASEFKGLPPRTAPSEYQAQAKAGTVTIAAEFTGHSVPTAEGVYTTEDYIVVEAALFGPPGARATLAQGDFSLRINTKKGALPSQPFELAFKSLKDPEWEPPSKEASKSKTSFGGGGGDSGSPPPPVHMPMDLRRAMEQRVQRAAMLEGDRALPQAGLLFFEYRGKTQSIKSIELIYNGSAGNATLALQP